MKQYILAVFVSLVFVVPVSAQTSQAAPPDRADVLVIAAGAVIDTPTPIATASSPISATSPLCGLATEPPAPTGGLVNPGFVWFDDPFTSGKFCRVPLPTGLPNGVGYRAVVQLAVATCAAGANCVAPRIEGIPPFDVRPLLTAPAAAKNVVVRP